MSVKPRMKPCLWCANPASLCEESNTSNVFCNVDCQKFAFVAGKSQRRVGMQEFLRTLGPLDVDRLVSFKGVDTTDPVAWNNAIDAWEEGDNLVMFRYHSNESSMYVLNYAESIIKQAGESLKQFKFTSGDGYLYVRMRGKTGKPKRQTKDAPEDVDYVYDLMYHGRPIPPYFSERVLNEAKARHRAIVDKFLVYANTGKLILLQLMLKNGFNPNATSPQGWTALMLAMNYPDIVRALLENPNTDRNARNDQGQTALEVYALYSINVNAFKELYADPLVEKGDFLDKLSPERKAKLGL